MIFKKTYKFLLLPSPAQRQFCVIFAGGCRWMYNHGLERKKLAYEEGKTLSYFDLNNELPLLKEAEDTQWLKDIPSQALQQSLKDLDSGFQHFFRRVRLKQKPGFPKFKRKGERESFRYPQGVNVQGNVVFLPKIGNVRFKKTREIQGTIKQTTIIEEDSKWYVCFSCEIDIVSSTQKIDEETTAGIDVGLSHYATVAMGPQNMIEEVDNPRFLKNQISKLRFFSKSLSKKAPKSRNRYKAKRKLQAFYVRMKNSRKDFAHKLSTRIVKNHDIIGIESLGVQTLLQSSPKSLSRSIADASFRQFLSFLKYKASERGKILIEMDRYFASTKTCSSCGKRNSLALSDRVLVCDCGLEIGRDMNAAINIKNAAVQKYKAAGMSV